MSLLQKRLLLGQGLVNGVLRLTLTTTMMEDSTSYSDANRRSGYGEIDSGDVRVSIGRISFKLSCKHSIALRRPR